MQVIETKNEGLIREFKVALAAAELQQKLDARLGELARTVKLPGFRPGKVPVTVVRKRFGASVKSEVLEQTISETSQSVITEHNLRPAARPKLEISSYEDDGDLEYTLAVELLPEVVPPDYSQIKLERMVAEVPEADVAKVLDHLARSKRTFTDVSEARPSCAGDVVVVDFVGPEDRKAFLGEQGKDVDIEVGEGAPLPGLGEQLEGLKVGDRKSISITFPEDSPMASLAGQAASYEIEVKALREAPPVPIDDQLAQDMQIENLEALKAEIRKQRTQELKSMARLRLKRALLDRLSELYSFDLPASLVEREYDGIVRQMSGEAKAAAGHDHDHEHVHDENCDHEHDHEHEAAGKDQELTDEQKAEFRQLAERRVRLGLVLAEIGRSNSLSVTSEELSRAMITEARRFSGQEQMVLEYFRNHAEAREALAAPILEDKVVDFVLEMAEVSERPVSVEELLRDPDEAPMSDAPGQPSP